jgi:hypothetical protein
VKWWRRNGHDSAEMLEKARRQERLTRKMTPAIETLAEQLADLPPDEFAERVRAAFRRRPA